MKKGLFTWITVLLAAALLLAGCADAAVDTNYADIVGYVTDSEGQPIEGATVTLPYIGKATKVPTAAASRSLTSVKAQKTDETGMFTFENVPSGTYNYEVTPEISKEGKVSYAMYKGLIMVDPLDHTVAELDGVYEVKLETVVLPKLGASLSGTVILNEEDDQEEIVIAASKEIVLALDNYSDYGLLNYGLFMPTVTGTGTRKDPYVANYSKYIKATTNAEGKVSFTNLPIMKYDIYDQKMSVSYFDLTTNQSRSGELDYDTDDTDDDVIYFGGLYPLTFTAGNIYLAAPAQDLYLVSTNTRDQYDNTDIFALAGDITLTFNRDVTYATAVIYKNSTASSPIVDSIVTVNDNVVTINPSVDLEFNTTYTVKWSAEAADGKKITDNTFTFKTIPDPVQPVTPVFTFVGIYNNGQNSFLIDVTGMNKDCTYYVESKDSAASAWNRNGTSKQLSNAERYDGTTARLSITTSDKLVSGKTLQVRLVSKYNTTEVLSDVVEVKDAVAPTSITFTGPGIYTMSTTAQTRLYTLSLPSNERIY